MRSLWRCRNSGWFLLSRKRDGWDVIDLETWICLFGDVLRICFFLQGWLCSLRGETRQEFAGGNQIVRIVSDKNTHQESKLKNECFVHFLFTELSIGGSTSTCNVFKDLSLMQWICVFLFGQGWLDADGCLGMAWVLILNVTVRETQKYGWR